MKPAVVVALGSTAALALLGNKFRVTQHRGEVVTSEWAGPVIATVHPSSVLRGPDAFRDDARREFFRDIATVADYIRKQPAASRTKLSTLRPPPPRRSTSRPTPRPTA